MGILSPIHRGYRRSEHSGDVQQRSDGNHVAASDSREVKESHRADDRVTHARETHPYGQLGLITLEKGLEPDECYYFANEPAVRGKDRIDLSVDPPPDLAIEVDISYRQMKRESIYAAMRVPEIWRWDGDHLDCLVLDANGAYQLSEFSKSLPMVRVRDLEQFIQRLGKEDETTIMRSFLDWVKALPG